MEGVSSTYIHTGHHRLPTYQPTRDFFMPPSDFTGYITTEWLKITKGPTTQFLSYILQKSTVYKTLTRVPTKGEIKGFQEKVGVPPTYGQYGKLYIFWKYQGSNPLLWGSNRTHSKVRNMYTSNHAYQIPLQSMNTCWFQEMKCSQKCQGHVTLQTAKSVTQHTKNLCMRKKGNQLT